MKETFIYKPKPWKQMTVNKFSLLIFIFCLHNLDSIACDCDQPDFVYSYLNADLIVEAKVSAFKLQANDELAYLEIKNVFKGPVDSTHILINGPLNKLGSTIPSSCDWTSVIGASHILYLKKSKHTGLYSAPYCSRRINSSSKTYSREIEWLEKFNPEDVSAAFETYELNSQPSFEHLKNEIEKVAKKFTPISGYTKFLVKINKMGDIESFGLFDKESGDSNRFYDRYTPCYDLRKPKSKLEKKVAKTIKTTSSFESGYINNQKVAYSVKIVFYYNETEKKVEFLGI